MTDTNNDTAYAPDDLPPVVVRFLEDHTDPESRRDIADLFASDGRVVDEGIEYLGLEAIGGWLGKAASAYTYTTTMLGQSAEEDGRWVVWARLEGNFPGGVADLRYRFATKNGVIADLVIAP
ncbi:hypothetical protein [Microbacterium sp. RU33B]|uniref:hypothetical protein n=1 Tax=Microbacterium sp. RU33B TaxID=1907390 RepID=UPI00096517C6|nr:hypothetical protein [Microbacterium sp. RU33B]SIT84137.1 hypothetical protein SAMN05880545_2150 [Microbacterium sp. RU33B]